MNKDQTGSLFPAEGPADGKSPSRKATYWLVALAAFLAGLMWSQCTLDRNDGKSRIDWPQSTPSGYQNPRKL